MKVRINASAKDSSHRDKVNQIVEVEDYHKHYYRILNTNGPDLILKTCCDIAEEKNYQMKIKIIKSNGCKWYSHRVGEIFNVLKVEEQTYLVNGAERILKSDCEVMNARMISVKSCINCEHHNNSVRCAPCSLYEFWEKKENDMNKDCKTCIHHSPHGCQVCINHDHKCWEGEKNIMELRMGDEVEVLCNHAVGGDTWEKRIFIKYGINDSVITVYCDHENKFKRGVTFDVVCWDKGDWRIPQEKQYRPFTFEDRELFRDKWVKLKKDEREFFISSIGCSAISTGYDTINYQNLLDR